MQGEKSCPFLCYSAGMSEIQSLIRFSNVTFAWPDPETGMLDVGKDGTLLTPVFDMFSADIPSGLISLTGPNGSGKSTFMLLAGARILPQRGSVVLAGRDSRVLTGVWADSAGAEGPGLTPETEHARNLVCSYIYQNMEFDPSDTDDRTIGELLEYIYANGGWNSTDSVLLTETVAALELAPIQERKLDSLSKGELQRVLLGFSALYGSKVILMDEPIFALEQRQKERALDFFKNLNRQTGVSVVVSLHELSLTRSFADTVLLFYPDRRIDMGTPEEVLIDSALEESYGVPSALLYDSEKLARKVLLERAEVLSEKNESKE